MHIGFPSLEGQAISFIGGRASFSCFLDGILSVQWLMNGTELEELNLTDVIVEFDNMRTTGNLLFTDLPLAFNGTTIQCRVTLSSGSEAVSGNMFILLIQGLFIHIIWRATLTSNSYIKCIIITSINM